jgi:hypothetical protein
MASINKRNIRFIEKTIGAAASYSSGDQVGAVLDLGKVGRVGAQLMLTEVKIFDDANQSAELDILFFKKTVADIGDNGVFALSIADLKNLIFARTAVAADYNTVANRGYALKTGTDMGALVLDTAGGDGHLFMVVVTQSTPTYTLNALRIVVALEELDT